MNSETAYAYRSHLQIMPSDQVYPVHMHYEKERKLSIVLLVTGTMMIIGGLCGMLLMGQNAYFKGIAAVLLLSGAVLACKGFLLNIKNQQEYTTLVRRLAVAKELTSGFRKEEHNRARRILLLLATEEIFLSLVFTTALILMHLVDALGFWKGIFEGLLPVITLLLLSNAYRAFLYSNYSNKVSAQAA